MTSPGEEVCEVIITAPDSEWLINFTRRLVEDRLAACGHIITPIRSIYRWQGNVEDEVESRVALHTRVNLINLIVEETKKTHPYEVPCVICLPITHGNPEYARWIIDQTKSDI